MDQRRTDGADHRRGTGAIRCPGRFPVSRLDTGQLEAAEAGGRAHPGLGLGSTGDRSPPDTVRGPVPVRRTHEQSSLALRVRRRGVRVLRPRPQGRPCRVLAGEPRPARVDLQAPPGRQVAKPASRQGARAHGDGRQVLLRRLREGGGAGVHVPGNRGHGDARPAHAAGPSPHAPTRCSPRTSPSPSR